MPHIFKASPLSITINTSQSHVISRDCPGASCTATDGKKTEEGVSGIPGAVGRRCPERAASRRERQSLEEREQMRRSQEGFTGKKMSGEGSKRQRAEPRGAGGHEMESREGH